VAYLWRLTDGRVSASTNQMRSTCNSLQHFLVGAIGSQGDNRDLAELLSMSLVFSAPMAMVELADLQKRWAGGRFIALQGRLRAADLVVVSSFLPFCLP
jgi:hypothetical protein